MNVFGDRKQAAKTAAVDELRRLGVSVSPYVVGRIIEAASPILTGDGPAIERRHVIDADSWEITEQ